MLSLHLSQLYPPILSYIFHAISLLCPETDLHMFRMFGRTGAPTKRGPTRRPANFCNTGTCNNLAVLVCVLRATTKKVVNFFGKELHIFSKQGPP